MGINEQFLSIEEQNRFRAFLRQSDKDLFLAAHYLKRWVISNAIGKRAKTLEFKCTAYKKPHLSNRLLNFNLSHSGAWVAIAISQCYEVGIDVEQQHSRAVWQNVLPQIASYDTILDSELRALQQWTANEATLKAIGTGFWADASQVKLQRKEHNFRTTFQKHNLLGAWKKVDARHLVAVASMSMKARFCWHICKSTTLLQSEILNMQCAYNPVE